MNTSLTVSLTGGTLEKMLLAAPLATALGASVGITLAVTTILTLAAPLSAKAADSHTIPAADTLLEPARQAAWQDDHQQAIQLYRQALQKAPHRRAEIVPALALQEFWAGHTEKALLLLREAVTLEPDDAELRYSLARCALQDGRPLESARHFAAARRLQPRNGAWLDDHATALHWAGLDDLAQRLPARHPPPGILRSQAPQITASTVYSDDSDDIDTRWLRLAAGAPAGDAGRFQLEAGSGHLREERPQTTAASSSDPTSKDADIDLSSATATLRWRWGTPTDPGGVWWTSASLGERRADDWRLTQWAADARWFPDDGVWLDASAGNDLIETPRAIAGRIEVEVYSLGQTFRSGDLWHWGLSESHLRFSDANHRNRVTAWGERRVDKDSPWSTGVSVLHFRDSDPGGDNGYYSPKRYDEARLYIDFAKSFRRSQSGLRLAGGRLDEAPGESHWLTALDLRWEWIPIDDHCFSARAGWSDSRVASSGQGDGYTRKYISVDWNWRP